MTPAASDPAAAVRETLGRLAGYVESRRRR
jgi:hypothetical protein